MMKKTMVCLLALALCMSLFAATASAHVVVYPKEATQGSYEVFTLRVPTEKEVPTVKVEVIIPEEVTISRFEPKPGWAYELERDSTDKIVRVVWTATEAGLSATEFGNFNMQGRVSESAESITWNAIQTYGDDSVVEWTGGADADHPASTTVVHPAPAGADGHGHASAEAAESGSSDMPLYLSFAALAISLGALALALRKKR